MERTPGALFGVMDFPDARSAVTLLISMRIENMTKTTYKIITALEDAIKDLHAYNHPELATHLCSNQPELDRIESKTQKGSELSERVSDETRSKVSA